MRYTLSIIDHSVKILDVAQAVTAQLQRVCGEAKAIVHDIKGAFMLEGVAGVPIGHNDLHHGCPVHDGSHPPPILIPECQTTLDDC